MREEEIEQIYAISRQVVKEEIKLAIEALKEELKAKPQTVKAEPSFAGLKKEVKKNDE